MNNPIQQLAEQAKKSIPKDQFTVEEWIQEYNQRLGELIVRRCAEIALREDHDPADCILSYFNLPVGADHHADKGYELSTLEKQEAFAKSRNYPLWRMLKSMSPEPKA